MSAAAYENILRLSSSLSREEKLRLIRELITHTKGSEETDKPEKDRSILELAGMGAEIWDGVDAQDYVRRERSSWNG